ncbi:MAG: homoserine dehydrogenase [Candidatus Firestonebacteria bacterium]|nr:homoserine dehydrogenase [Candidatus Firestonebacteria bacterium]
MKTKINIGIIGFGTVGAGTVKVLTDNRELIKTKLGTEILIKKIADKDIKTPRPVKVSSEILTTKPEDILLDPEIDIVIELIGGYSPAKEFILQALKNKKHVVTANKALLAMHGGEIFETAYKNNVNILYEASVGGGIPVLRALREGLSSNKINAIYGIINGTANYILSKMSSENSSFVDVLNEAQEKGYAEKDPSFDIEGIDSAHKLSILAYLAYGCFFPFKNIYTEGISQVTPLDITYARELGYVIKLLGIIKNINNRIELRVHPTMIPIDYLLASVNGVFNGIYISGDPVGDTLFYGRGAGALPTGSAVVSDVMDIARHILNRTTSIPEFKWQNEYKEIVPMNEIETSYYIRMNTLDESGVLSKIAGIFAKYNISIFSVIQKGKSINNKVNIIMMTHKSIEKNMRQAITEIDSLPVVNTKSMIIRVENRD